MMPTKNATTKTRAAPVRRTGKKTPAAVTHLLPNSLFGQGSLATAGNSHAVRIDKAFVRQNPVLAKTGLKVRFKKVGANTFVFVVNDAEPREEESDPVVAAYLAFLEEGMVSNPSQLAPFTAAEAARIERLVRGVKVDDTDQISLDVTI